MLNQRTRRQASQRGEIRRQISQVGGMCNGSPNNYEGPHLARECPKRKWGSFTLAGAQVELDEEEQEELDSEVQVKASSVKVFVMKVKGPSPKNEGRTLKGLSTRTQVRGG